MIEIKNKSDCCGCAACAGICPKNNIEMREDSEGFRYPQIIAENCVNCGLCERVCPILNSKDGIIFEQEGYIVQNKEQKILRESTAGGAFTAIANYALRKNGVVFGAELSVDLEVRHVYIETEAELSRFRNSKYVQSFVGGDIYRQAKTFLDQERTVCFSGTPCQIEGLKNYLGKDYLNLITVDVVCRAVPSPLIFRKYIGYQEHKLADKIKSMRFRDKHYGYKYSTMSVIFDRNQDNYHKGVESDPWLRAFFSNICDRPSCHSCHFRKSYRNSDFTIWDCFHVGRFSKELDNDKGATRMLVHTVNGKEIFKSVCSDFLYTKVEPEIIIAGVVEMKESVKPNEKREEFFLDAGWMSDTQLFEKYFPKTIRVKAEYMVRMACYKLGIYAVVKKIFVRISHKY
ncbi:Coenzyme F420 hydrogenase/dehydrogenase, beta subunit C-terminal domain [Lacrimispora sp.]|uniref:Coenzyme F420 hydrogenase/dehydrogenase, beta subunit C-terminal domain n=1 Tax=Lacrimispora sp. TaxID=2719234 RepID=UPI00285F6F43|nr:Coenzyme F420 hydrogenase/dehydrogenase, beta subunit C-terminal domain [Lacrimispora sp.]MDR7813050.1 Coenzyme F420 hydrogenase/dehydrogenase, beta subunit C-terminal domain [Lacrimispora sp.]